MHSFYSFYLYLFWIITSLLLFLTLTFSSNLLNDGEILLFMICSYISLSLSRFSLCSSEWNSFPICILPFFSSGEQNVFPPFLRAWLNDLLFCIRSLFRLIYYLTSCFPVLRNGNKIIYFTKDWSFKRTVSWKRFDFLRFRSFSWLDRKILTGGYCLQFFVISYNWRIMRVTDKPSYVK